MAEVHLYSEAEAAHLYSEAQADHITSKPERERTNERLREELPRSILALLAGKAMDVSSF